MATAIAEAPVMPRPARRRIVTRPRTIAAKTSPVQSALLDDVVTKSSEIIPQLVKDHQASVWRYLRALGCPADLAEDLTQEAFLLAYSRPFEYRGPAAAASYLRRAAYHRYISHLQRHQASQIELREIEVNDATWTRWCKDQRDHSEVLDVLNDCLAELPPRIRHALELRFRDGLSRQQIAKELSMTEHGAKNLLQRAKQRLRESVELRLNATVVSG